MDSLKLTDLVKVDILQELQDVFAATSHIATGISDENGAAVTRHALSSDFCGKLTKGSEKGRKRCEECDRCGAKKAAEQGKAVIYSCHTGLIDFAAPIMVRGKLLGCFVGGQILLKPPKKEDVVKIAEDLGIDPEEYWEAAKRIPVVSREALKSALKLIYTVANTLSNIAENEYQVLCTSREMEQVSRMKSDFLANMSHEIRTPMNAVIGMADMALREELPPVAREYILQIKNSGNALLAIINDILDFSKIESGKMEITMVEYSPIMLISEVGNIIATRIGNKDVELVLDVSPDLPGELMGDNLRLKQIITNLANNAVKFTRKGQVVLQMGGQYLKDQRYELQVSVKDTGIGIKKENLAKIFESFQQVDSKRNRNIEGTGLGLAISKQLVELMGGTLSVESEYEVGSVFSFRVPQLELHKQESITIKDKSKIIVAGLLQNPYAKKQLEKDIKRLGGTYIDLQSESELPRLEQEGGKILFDCPEEIQRNR